MFEKLNLKNLNLEKLKEKINFEGLNLKKVAIAVAIGIFLIISIVVFTISRVGAKNNEGVEIENTEALSQSQTPQPESNIDIFKDDNETVSIELNKKYNFIQSQNNEYLIKISSDNDSDVYISKLDGMEGRELYSVARADRLAYLESYNSYSNTSDLKELNVNGNQAFTYSFHYLDENLKKAFYIQVVLLKVGDRIYVFDFDFPLDELNFYTNLLTETLAEFKVLQ